MSLLCFMIRICIVLTLTIIGLSMNSCLPLLKGQTLEVPAELKNGKKLSVKHPIVSASAGQQIYIIKDGLPDNTYKSTLNWETVSEMKGFINNPHRASDLEIIISLFIKRTRQSISDLDIREMKSGDVAEIDEYVYHKLEFSSAIKKTKYTALSKTKTHRQIEQTSERSSEETAIMESSVEFFVYQGQNEFGHAILRDYSMTSGSFFIDVTLDSSHFQIEYQSYFNKTKASVSKDAQIIAFFDMRPAAFVTTEEKGDLTIQNGLTGDILDNICTAYMLAKSIMAAAEIK